MKPLILVVDDDPAVLRLANLLLSANGYEVLTAVRGLEALRLVRAHRPSVVVLDMAIPGVDGVGVMSEMRRDPVLRSIPVVAISGLFEPGQLPSALERQCVAFLEKPVSLHSLLEEVRLASGRL